MPYVEVDDDMRWTAEQSLLCPQMVQMAAADTPYVAIDFSNLLDSVDDLVISSVAAITEKKSLTIAANLEVVSDDGKRVSFKIASNGGANDYTLQLKATLNKGTTNVISRECLLRVI